MFYCNWSHCFPFTSGYKNKKVIMEFESGGLSEISLVESVPGLHVLGPFSKYLLHLYPSSVGFLSVDCPMKPLITLTRIFS